MRGCGCSIGSDTLSGTLSGTLSTESLRQPPSRRRAAPLLSTRRGQPAFGHRFYAIDDRKEYGRFTRSVVSIDS